MLQQAKTTPMHKADINMFRGTGTARASLSIFCAAHFDVGTTDGSLLATCCNFREAVKIKKIKRNAAAGNEAE